jgi:hypothetical protein
MPIGLPSAHCLHQPLQRRSAITAGEAILAGHGVRDGKALIAACAGG